MSACPKCGAEYSGGSCPFCDHISDSPSAGSDGLEGYSAASESYSAPSAQYSPSPARAAAVAGSSQPANKDKPLPGCCSCKFISCMLILLVIASLFVVFVVPARVIPGMKRAKINKIANDCQTNLNRYAAALDMYAADNYGLYPHTLDKVYGYDPSMPLKCPACGRDTYSANFRSSEDPKRYTLMCAGHAHAKAGYAPNYPRYYSDRGIVRDISNDEDVKAGLEPMAPAPRQDPAQEPQNGQEQPAGQEPQGE
ncbi:MAG: hypothetical protein K6G50_03680 [bacterium]|nr:hypothetical protein [bacterium]